MNFKRFLIDKGVKSNAEKITILQAIQLVDEWEQAKQLALTSVGCSLPSLEEVDSKILTEYIDSQKIVSGVDNFSFGLGFIKCFRWFEKRNK